jgi:hypothetical protein
MFKELSGKKTYIIAAVMVFFAILDVIQGSMTVSQLVSSDNLRLLLEGLGLASLRAGVSKIGK